MLVRAPNELIRALRDFRVKKFLEVITCSFEQPQKSATVRKVKLYLMEYCVVMDQFFSFYYIFFSKNESDKNEKKLI